MGDMSAESIVVAANVGALCGSLPNGGASKAPLCIDAVRVGFDSGPYSW
jgi:hypothetical protein